MNNPLLTDEELDKIANAVDETQFETSSDYFKAILRQAIQAQAKKLVEQLDEHLVELNGFPSYLGITKWDWQALCKEVGLDA